MRQTAVALAAALVFALVAPAFAQPFADVPTNHWAYDAIAELAAKGLVEGYPDGTFKGDRAMTRYEMAMVVARLLARIESIQIPAPAGPQVTKADLDALQRLINEFRAELAALGVRVTAIEEELNAIKAKLDNVRITGKLRLREDVAQDTQGGTGVGSTAASPGVNGNLRTSTTSASNVATVNRPRELFKLAFDAAVSPDVHFNLALINSGAGYEIFNSSATGAGFGNGAFGTVDDAFFQWKNAWGWPLEIRVGRMGGDLGVTYPVQFGPFGLIMNTGGDTWEDSSFDSGINVADGLWVQWHAASVADLMITGTVLRVMGGTGSPLSPLSGGSYLFGEDAYGVDANIQIFPGLRLGANYVGNTITPANNNPGPQGFGNVAQWHLYGPGGGSFNPGNTGVVSSSSYHCVTNIGANAVAMAAAGWGGNGIDCPALGNGWGVYVMWDAFPGIHFDGEWAQWTDSVFNTTDNGWQVNIHWDLGAMLGVGHKFSLDTGYLNYGQNFYPPYGAAEADIAAADAIYPGNANGWTAGFSFNLSDAWRFYGTGFFGNNASNGQQAQDWEAGIVYSFAPSASITFKYRTLSMGGVSQFNLYRAQLDYSF
ncbi:MAG TPA: S-layer homology domain-containing protein [bacterium]|nr:S-layer homology domain-containing protein [bacterium]